MRTLLMLALVLMQYGAMANDVPPIVEKNFKAKFPQATEVEWYDEEGGTYAAYFYEQEQSKTAKFTASGTWTETSTLIDNSQIPATVVKAIKTAYGSAEINGSTLLERPNALNQYEVNIEVQDQTVQLLYDAKGELLKKLEEVSIPDDGDEDMDEDDSEDE